MDLLNDTRLASLPKALLRNMTLTMRKHLLLLLALHFSDVLLLWLLFTVGLFIKWMWKMLSSMETSKRKCTCNHPLAILTRVVKFVAFVVLFMASNRLLSLGLKSLAQLLLSRVSLRVFITLLSSFEDPLLVSLLFFFMLMTWWFLEMILQVSTFFSISLVSILRWKIWALSAIFLGLRLPHLLMDTIFPKLNMLMTSL